MPYTDFSELDRLHSEWSRMKKAAKMGWLSGEKVWLFGLANQFSHYIYAKRSIMNDVERTYACKLIEMIKPVDAECSKVMADLRNDAFREIIKCLINNKMNNSKASSRFTKTCRELAVSAILCFSPCQRLARVGVWLKPSLTRQERVG